MSRPTKQYICLVDSYRRPSRKRNTAGRYQVGARDEKEARKFLKDRIGFGSIVVLCIDESPEKVLQRGQMVKIHIPGARMLQPGETIDDFMAQRIEYLPVRHATAPQKGVSLNG